MLVRFGRRRVGADAARSRPDPIGDVGVGPRIAVEVVRRIRTGICAGARLTPAQAVSHAPTNGSSISDRAMNTDEP